jgi:hypothetical protein
LEAPLAVSWWMAAVDALEPSHHPHSPHDDHQQLVAPEPFDAADEPGLFA